MIVYCHHGMRSLQVASWLSQNGFTNVKSMQGGIDAWSCEIDDTKPRY
ncbi:MAG: rhodanese-like domain-containing protein [Gimesia chilikensis]